MNLHPIKNDTDYEAALAEIERLFDAAPGTPESERLEALVTLVEAYEDQNYDVPLPDPVEAIKYYAESRGLSLVDFETEVASLRHNDDFIAFLDARANEPKIPFAEAKRRLLEQD